MSERPIETRIRNIAAGVAGENGLEFVHSEVVGTRGSMTVRVFIDKPGGVSHEDCAKVSRALDALLDNEDLIPTTYILEVSSPGLERELYSIEDFRRFAGQPARVKTREAIDGQRNFRGKIIAIEDTDIVFDDRTNGTVRFPYSLVIKANLEIDLEEELKKH
jgi:ribosome maturation factor RimP